MKRVVLFFIFLSMGFVAGYGSARWGIVKFLASRFASPAQSLEGVIFHPTQFPIENRHFAIVVIARNNGAYLEKNLQSVLSQNYEHFRLLYIDDASDDGSFDLACEMIRESLRSEKVEFMRNEAPKGFLASLASAVRSCPRGEIVVILHGEDWLAHEWVLQRLNQYYADPDLWLTYGQSCDFPTFHSERLRPHSPVEKRIRDRSFPASRPETFYAGLFQKITDTDFLYQGEYFQTQSAMPFLLPMLEMSEGHCQCLPDLLYICNREAAGWEEGISQEMYEEHIRRMPAYGRLEHLALHNEAFD